jgi:hypothetical protein
MNTSWDCPTARKGVRKRVPELQNLGLSIAAKYHSAWVLQQLAYLEPFVGDILQELDGFIN